MGARLIDMEGKKIGKYTVLADHVQTLHGTKWLCQCECGGDPVWVYGHNLRVGRQLMCRECFKKATSERSYKHGQSGGGKNAGMTPEYRAWRRAKNHCYNPEDRDFHLYGGRGISMHQTWLNDFAAFYEHIGPRPSKHHSLDRYPNMNGDYEPGNVRWATRYQQGRNRRDTIFITFKGENAALKDHCDKYGVAYSSVCTRHYKRHQSWEDAFNYVYLRDVA
jgi:hypothetical protein